jgi:hypothetical protein
MATSDLITTSLLDCSGVVTHRLTLLADGTVEIRFPSGGTATVEPRTGRVLTPGRVIPEQVLAAARSLEGAR